MAANAGKSAFDIRPQSPLIGGSMLSRRQFLRTTSTAATASFCAPLFAQGAKAKIKLGFDNFAVRGMGWKASQLLDHAALLKCDSLFISDIDSYESLEDAALREVKKKAADLGMDLYSGGWSI